MKTVETPSNVQYEIFMLCLSLLALATVAATSFFRLDPDVRSILRWADNAICFVFLSDFLITFYRSNQRRRYFFTWGWIDLLSSIPVVGGFRFARVARVWRLIRLLRGARAARLIASFILERRAQSAFFAGVLLILLAVVLASIAVLQCEHGPNVNIKGPADALWWSFTTVVTLGFGDHFPVTTGGRVIGVLLMLLGVGLVGTISGLFAAWFLAPAAHQQQDEMALLHREIAALRETLLSISALGSDVKKESNLE